MQLESVLILFEIFVRKILKYSHIISKLYVPGWNLQEKSLLLFLLTLGLKVILLVVVKNVTFQRK